MIDPVLVYKSLCQRNFATIKFQTSEEEVVEEWNRLTERWQKIQKSETDQAYDDLATLF
jgi:hypothetical protein